MHAVTTTEWTEAVNADIETAVGEIIASFMPTLDDYLQALDQGTFECSCTGGISIKFTPEHQVIATLPLTTIEGYSWAFRSPTIEAEVDGTFEARLS